MRISDPMGQTTGYMDVLAVQTTATVTDSFFLGGSPAPAMLLSAFGLTQGLMNSTYKIAYYRKGEVQPLLTVSYSDNTYTTPTAASAHNNRLAPSSATGVAGIPVSADVNVYPNPAINGNLNISIGNAASGQWSYELYNVAGQKLMSGALQPGASSVSTGNNTGMHFLRISKDGNLNAVKTVILQ